MTRETGIQAAVEIAAREKAKTDAWIRKVAVLTASTLIALGFMTSFYSLRGDLQSQEVRKDIAANTAYLISCTVPASDLPAKSSEERRHKNEELKKAERGERCNEAGQKRTNQGPVLAIINENDRRVCVRFEQAFDQLSERKVFNPPLVFDCSTPIPFPESTP